MIPPRHRYLTDMEDGRRWLDFPMRAGDIVISTRSKHGTTWMQMICALLSLRTSELPAPLPELSPWLEWLVLREEDVFADLAAQRHRRFIKTHLPLDGLPLDDRAHYIVVARHPLDAAVSLYHHGANLDRQKIRELIERASGTDYDRPASDRPPVDRWLADWVDWEGQGREELDSLPGVFWHLSDAWERRHEANVVLVHYADLLADLPGEMSRLAERLGFSIEEDEIRRLSKAATFDAMRLRGDSLAPAPDGVFRDRRRFFRQGGTGAGRAVADAETLALYERRAADLAPPDLLAWLHR